MRDYESLSDALTHLGRAGYQFNFEMESSSLYCAFLDIRLTTDEFDVTEVYRFDETSDPKDERVLYLISSFAGIKGTVVLVANDVYSESMSFEMAYKLRTHPYGEWICS